MAETYPFRGLREKNGVFLLATLAVVITLALLAGRAQRWLEPTTTFGVRLPPEGSYGLRAGSEVEVLGTVVGAVDEVTIEPETGRMEARVSIQRDFAAFVRVDSTAVLKLKLGVAGDAYLSITRGAGAALEGPEDTIPLRLQLGPTDAIQTALDELRAGLAPAVDELRAAVREYTLVATEARTTLAEYGALAARFQDPDGSLEALLANSARLVETIERGEGLLGRLLSDRELALDFDRAVEQLGDALEGIDGAADELGAASGEIGALASSLEESARALPAVLEDARGVLQRAQGVLDDLRRATEPLPEISGALRQEARDLPGLVADTQRTVVEIERLVEALERHWLLRGLVEPDAPPGRLSPAELGPGDPP